ncbi:MAG TPA: beta-galactosidase [Candidatus Aminicenantes bacterium]|nr:beta-galactosidase [Candidatus Aminicenantes bacterium]HRY64254.1 beta-galactosidase [Candidatus Aminicenantes bacterium]HRZ71167.1 beta-galactosidase [Candidatus Aminicenantes bacterium]
MRFRRIALAAALAAGLLTPAAAAPQRTFRLDGKDFLLDGKPFRIMAGEMHYQRVPREYWADRLTKLKAAGLNTVGTYVFWNALEPEPGSWDFAGANDLAAFIRTAQRIGLWVIVRPGPYACAEWDFGGLPAWLLRTPDIKVRCSDPRYLAACESYILRLGDVLGELQIGRGGPVIMVQVENEYGSYGNDRDYLQALQGFWERAGLEVPLYTADGATPHMLEAGSLPGAAIGLDPGTSEKDFAEAERLRRGVPVFCSELYPGWLTHWGEPWAKVGTEEFLPELRWLLDHGKSFSLYMFHGGTNFGFTAGANFGDRYQPDVTSYDYDAPLDEAGRPRPKYFAIRDLLARYQPKGAALPDPPEPLPAIAVPAVGFDESASVFDNLPPAVRSAQPGPMESYGQNQGFILYRTRLLGHRGGKLAVTDLHDYATVFVDGRLAGAIDRTKGEATGLEIPKAEPANETLDILVEAMGRINYGPRLLDRKGITDRVTLNNMTLMGWDVHTLPLDAEYLERLRFVRRPPERPGAFFRGRFDLASVGDTYLDMSGWKKGVVWVNGHNLGRYWEAGPQKRLFCPAPFLTTGTNEIVVFDLLTLRPAPVAGFKDLE